MSEFELLNWEVLPGNKYSKALDPAMLTADGCIVNQKVRHSSEPKGQLCNVVYDRIYAVTFIRKKVIDNLCVAGRQEIHKLVDEAWEQAFPDSIESVPVLD